MYYYELIFNNMLYKHKLIIILLFSGRGILCECAGASACPDGAANGTCTTQPGGYCFVAVEKVLDENELVVLERTAGCLPPDESGFMQVGYSLHGYLLFIMEQ